MQFGVNNTPGVKATQKTAKAHRGPAALANIVTGVLQNLGLHDPVAAAIGHPGQSECELAVRLQALLTNRLYGYLKKRGPL
jgi:hypothetical protein